MEHDNSFTWQDIKAIVHIADEELELHSKKDLVKMGEEGYYTLILQQYESLKKEGLI